MKLHVINLLMGTVSLGFLALSFGKETLDSRRPVSDHDKILLRQRTLQEMIAEAVVFPSPCLPLPADRTPHVGEDDDGWKLVDFCLEGDTGSDPANLPDCHQNDDDSSSEELSTFLFTLYGTDFSKIFINNNGNLSFETLYSTFSAEGFPIADFPMVAPFWADVDTGNSDNHIGHVWIKRPSSNVIAVAWDIVGHFDEESSRRNTFQVLISDGSDASMGIGNNVCFCYDQMEWTTGDESSGVDGFGGIPATVGANKGNGVDFFQVGRFNRNNSDYDGPNGNEDGVDWLEGESICFNAAGTTNIPPVATQFPAGDSITVECGSTLDLELLFLSPEEGQTTTVGVENAPESMIVLITFGNTAMANLQWTPAANEVGTYILTFTAVDDFATPGQTVKTLTILVTCPTSTTSSTVSETTGTQVVPKEEPPCNPSFCQACYYWCGHPPYGCDDTEGMPKACVIDPICDVCDKVCLESGGGCAVGCPSGDFECPVGPARD